jgi:predicted nucleic acid-binding protein
MTAAELQEQIDELLKQLKSLQEQLIALEKPKDLKTINSKKAELRIVPDSSWLIAVLDENDTHHIPANSSFGAMLPYNPIFYIPSLVYLETISRLIRVNKISVKKCEQKIGKFLSRVNYKHSRTLEIPEILSKYKKFSRVKLSKLHPIDFYIVTEGVFLAAKILTCDLKMYHYASKYYQNIYFMTDKIKQKNSDLANLIRDIQTGK